MIKSEDTIVARATVPGRSALAIIRVSGGRAHEIVAACIKQNSRFLASQAGFIAPYTLVDSLSAEVIDFVTSIRYVAPRSYTGEDSVELFLHGGEYLLECAIAALIRSGARIAQPGEFTKRAFLNGKLDLLRAEAVIGLTDSGSAAQHASAVGVYQGAVGRKLVEIKHELVEILVDLESRIEFPEDDDIAERSVHSGSVDKLWTIHARLQAELAGRDRLKAIEKGVVIAIVGESNVGKSSLFNALLESNRSIVHHSKGTTRDSVSETVFLDGVHATIVDTAGVGIADHAVEALGIERSWEYVRDADFAVLVTSAQIPDLTDDELKIIDLRRGRPLLGVVSNADRAMADTKVGLLESRIAVVVSANLLDSAQLGTVRTALCAQLGEVQGARQDTSVAINERQEAALRRMVLLLDDLRAESAQYGDEILAEYVRALVGHIEEFVGSVSSDVVLERIFSQFCIGK